MALSFSLKPWAWVVAAAATLTACSPSRERDATRPLELMVSSDGETLDPRYATDAVALRTTRLIHAGLTRLDPTSLAPVPYLAKSWAWIDARTLRVELRDDVVFHSGAPFTSRDVVATLRAFASPKVASRHARVVEAIAGADEDGPHAVTVRLSRAHATLLTDLELPILRADQADGPPDPRGLLDGLGPYVVARAAPGAVALEPAEQSALPRPRHAVTIRTVHDENARAMRLYAGRADVALNQISPTLLPALESSRSLAVTSRAGSNLTYVVVRHGRGPLDDVRVRRALSMAIDRATLTRTLLGGYARPARGVLGPTHWSSPGASEPELPFDPPAAARALDEAGARPLHLTMLTSTDRLRLSIARTIAQELADVGVDLEVIPLNLGTMLARLNAGDFELATLQLPEMTEPHVFRNFLGSEFVPPAGNNRGRARDAELDSLLAEGGSTEGMERRRAIYARASARIVDQMLVIPLWHEDQIAVTSERAATFAPSAEGRWLSIASVP